MQVLVSLFEKRTKQTEDEKLIDKFLKVANKFSIPECYFKSFTDYVLMKKKIFGNISTENLNYFLNFNDEEKEKERIEETKILNLSEKFIEKKIEKLTKLKRHSDQASTEIYLEQNAKHKEKDESTKAYMGKFYTLQDLRFIIFENIVKTIYCYARKCSCHQGGSGQRRDYSVTSCFRQLIHSLLTRKKWLQSLEAFKIEVKKRWKTMIFSLIDVISIDDKIQEILWSSNNIRITIVNHLMIKYVEIFDNSKFYQLNQEDDDENSELVGKQLQLLGRYINPSVYKLRNNIEIINKNANHADHITFFIRCHYVKLFLEQATHYEQAKNKRIEETIKLLNSIPFLLPEINQIIVRFF
jgi:hypothetical protein